MARAMPGSKPPAPRRARRVVGFGVVAWFAMMLSPGSMPAQEAPGFHDITSGGLPGPDVTGGTFFPQRPRNFTPVTAARIEFVGTCVVQHLDVRAIVSPIDRSPVSTVAQATVRDVLTGAAEPDGLAAVLAGGGATTPANDLADALFELARWTTASRVAEAVTRFNELIDASSDAFLADPPDELLVVHAVLAMLGLEQDCVPLPRISVCVMTPDFMASDVEFFVHPVTGDTLTTGGPYRVVYGPDRPQYAASHDWFMQGAPIVFGGTEFVPFGEPRRVAGSQVIRAGMYSGVVVFADAGASAPYGEVLVPVGPGCEFQPYVPRAQVEQPIAICVVTPDGALGTVQAVFRPAVGDTLVAGRPFEEVHHPGEPQYGAGHEWFVQDAPIAVGGREFVKFGVARVLDAGALRPTGTFDGVPIFVDAQSGGTFTEVFVPVAPGCAFQPYLAREEIRIRG